MFSHSIRRPTAAFMAIGLTLLLATGATADSPPGRGRNPAAKPTIVLVHGAFADASSWNLVIDRLQDSGFPVIAPADPLRAPIADSQYTASVLDTLSGPLVLVGHSYAGMIISNAAAMTKNAQNVKALVYVSAFLPKVGESAGDLLNLPGSLVGPTTTLTRPCPGASCTDIYIDPSHFHEVMGADLPVEQTTLLATTQRPAEATTFSEKSEFAAWQTIPTFAVVPSEDRAVGTANELFMAQRARAQITEVKGASHLVMLSHPEVVVKVIEAAAGDQ